MDRKAFGSIGENAAAEMLREKGYMILKRNYRCPWGEIDIIASKDGKLSFIEVKTRSCSRYGRPCEAVDTRKQQRIKKIALCYLNETSDGREDDSYIGFDVIEIFINHMKDAF